MESGASGGADGSDDNDRFTPHVSVARWQQSGCGCWCLWSASGSSPPRLVQRGSLRVRMRLSPGVPTGHSVGPLRCDAPGRAESDGTG
jgi:hypothetical protein